MIYTDLSNFKIRKSIFPVKEEYYGRTKNIDIIYQNLSSLVNEILKMSELEAGYFSPNFDKRNIAIEKAIEQEFGFKRCILHWEHVHQWVFGTYPGGIIFETAPGLKSHILNKKKNEKYYDKEKNYTDAIAISSYGIRHIGLTANETMGFLLHEIGHSMDNTFGRFFVYAYQMLATFGLYEFLELGMKHGIVDLDRIMIRDYPISYGILDFFLQVFNEVRGIMSFLSGPLMIPGIILFSILSGTFLIHHPMSKSEAFCDTFAAKYGFGPDLASGMQKIYENETKLYPSKIISELSEVPILRTLIDLWMAPVYLVSEIFFDMHPAGEIRIENIRKDLERDYNDPEIPKEFKPHIKKQIEECKRIQSYDMKSPAEKQMIFTAIRRFLYYKSPLRKFATFWNDIGKEEPENYDYNTPN